MSKLEKFIAWCDKAMAFSFYALIYFLPISIALSETFTVSALVFFFLKRGTMFYGAVRQRVSSGDKIVFWKEGVNLIRAFKPVKNCLNWPIAIYLFLNIVSVIFSHNRGVSIEGFLGKSLQSAFLYFNFIECMNSRKRLKKFILVALISCLLICTNGITQYFTGKGFIHGNLVYSGRISSSFRAHNDFAGYLVSIIPILLGICLFNAMLLIDRRSRGNGVNLEFKVLTDPLGASMVSLLMLMALFCLGCTLSRGAWIAFLLSLLIIGSRGKKLMIACILIFVMFFWAFYPKLYEERRVGLLSDPLSLGQKAKIEKLSESSVYETSEDTAAPVVRNVDKVVEAPVKTDQARAGAGEETVQPERRRAWRTYLSLQWKKFLIISKTFGGSGRRGYWQEAINMIKDYPVFGVGLNTYSIVGRGYKINWGGYPHNCYLQMAVEIGIVGLLSFLWIIFAVFRNSLRSFRRIDGLFLQFLLIGGLSGYAGFLIHSFFDTNFYSVQLGSLMWLLMGFVVAVKKIGTREQTANA